MDDALRHRGLTIATNRTSLTQAPLTGFRFVDDTTSVRDGEARLAAVHEARRGLFATEAVESCRGSKPAKWRPAINANVAQRRWEVAEPERNAAIVRRSALHGVRNGPSTRAWSRWRREVHRDCSWPWRPSNKGNGPFS